MKDKEGIFKVYNVLKSSDKVDPSRLSKALSMAQRKEQEPKYFTNLSSCTCPDQSHRSQIVCKHRLAYMMTHANEFSAAYFLGDIL